MARNSLEWSGTVFYSYCRCLERHDLCLLPAIVDAQNHDLCLLPAHSNHIPKVGRLETGWTDPKIFDSYCRCSLRHDPCLFTTDSNHSPQVSRRNRKERIGKYSEERHLSPFITLCTIINFS